MEGVFKIGPPVQYTSIYHYAKWRFPVLNEAGDRVGWVKQEKVVDENGEESGATYYTRDLPKPYGAKRFYSSPQALVIALGGKIDRTAPNPLAATANSPDSAKIIAAAYAPEISPDALVEDAGSAGFVDAVVADVEQAKAEASPGKSKSKTAPLLASADDVIKSAKLSERAFKAAATRKANKLAAEKLAAKTARAEKKAKADKAAKRIAKRIAKKPSKPALTGSQLAKKLL